MSWSYVISYFIYHDHIVYNSLYIILRNSIEIALTPLLNPTTHPYSTTHPLHHHTTLHTKPHYPDLPMPRILNINATVVEVYWYAPVHPNGPLLQYRLYRSKSGAAGIFTRIASIDDQESKVYKDSNLTPQTLYGYIVEVSVVFILIVIC